jgi:hypothetical protein
MGKDDLGSLAEAQAAIINEARRQIATGGTPDATSFERRLRDEGRAARKKAPSLDEAIDAAERAAVKQLGLLMRVHQARRRIEQVPEPPPAATPRPSLRSALRTRPTIVGNMDFQRSEHEGTLILTWDPAPGVADWEIRFSERPRPGAEYVTLETVTLPATTTNVIVPVGENAFRVNVVGRSRDGRPRSRAVISGLTKSSWSERWERRATAS